MVLTVNKPGGPSPRILASSACGLLGSAVSSASTAARRRPSSCWWSFCDNSAGDVTACRNYRLKEQLLSSTSTSSSATAQEQKSYRNYRYFSFIRGTRSCAVPDARTVLYFGRQQTRHMFSHHGFNTQSKAGRNQDRQMCYATSVLSFLFVVLLFLC